MDQTLSELQEMRERCEDPIVKAMIEEMIFEEEAKSKEKLGIVLNDLTCIERIDFYGNVEYHLTKDLQEILRCIVMELRAYHDKGMAYGFLSMNTVAVWKERLSIIDGKEEYKWTAKLLFPDSDYSGGYQKDITDLVNLVEEILNGQPRPKDVDHLLNVLKQPNQRVTELLYYHPCFWTTIEERKNVEQMRMAYKRARDKNVIAVAAQQVPIDITGGWTEKIPNNSFLGELFEAMLNKPEDNSLGPDAIGLLFFMRYIYNHAIIQEDEGCKKIQNAFYCIYPEFMSNFVEQVFHIDSMREAIQGS